MNYPKYKKIDLTNHRFGNITVLRQSEVRNKYKSIMWVCVCDCDKNKEFLVSSSDLKRGKKDNCGCMTRTKQSTKKKKYNTYDLSGEYGIGYTFKGEEFYFDKEDYDLIKDYCWYIHAGYVVARGLGNNKEIRLHRLVMNVTDKNIRVDHIYHNTIDNRKSQLRACTNQQNCFNHKIHKNNTSGKSGISYRKESGKWRVRIWCGGKCYSLGDYVNYEDAIKVRIEKEKELFGEYRCENEVL